MDDRYMPSVVTAFSVANEGRTDGPRLEILEMPQSKFRFRYKSEMVGTHGQLKSEKADRKTNIFPTVRLVGWREGPAVIRLMLYSADDNPNLRQRHVHELSGKGCDKSTGICEIVADEKNDYTAVFQNLGIVHIAKREVKDIILERKKEQLIREILAKNPKFTLDDARRRVSPTHTMKLNHDAEEEAKEMNLNKVVLRFQAFFFDPKLNDYRPITPPTDSDIVYNLKNASTGELKIVRMSAVSAPCTGGTEVYMLVEKVKKNNIKIKFFETDEDDAEIWTSYGEFNDSDVHHQYAIVFKTPPYRSTDLRSPVKVRVQLERISDNDISEPRIFTYLPEVRKRSVNYMDCANDDESEEMRGHDQYKKKFCRGGASPSYQRPGSQFTLPPGRRDNSPGVLQNTDSGTYMKGLNELQEMPLQQQQQQMCRVPSPLEPADSPQSRSFYSPTHNSGSSVTLQVPSPFNYHPNSPQLQTLPSEDLYLGSPSYENSDPGSSLFPPQGVQGFQTSLQFPLSETAGSFAIQQEAPCGQQLMQNPQEQQAISPQQFMPVNYLQQVPALDQQSFLPAPPGGALAGSNLFMQSSNTQEPFGIPVCDEFSGLLPNDLSYNIENLVDLVDVVTNINSTTYGSNGNADIRADSAGRKTEEKSSKEGKEGVQEEGSPDVDALVQQMESCRVDETTKSDVKTKAEGATSSWPIDVAFRVAVSAAESLHAYAATGDIGPVLKTHKYLLAMQNSNGDNALHAAVYNRKWDVFSRILSVAEKVKPHEMLNAQNNDNETPLHVAVKLNDSKMVESLLAVPLCDPLLPDARGNTPIHVGASLPTQDCLRVILHKAVKTKSQKVVLDVIETYNYEGATPLHLAVMSGNLENVKMILKLGANVHSCERKRGANPLHLATLYDHFSIASHLIYNTRIAIEGRMFDGNTALHISVQKRSKNICKLLIRAGADPKARNSIRKKSVVEVAGRCEGESQDKTESSDEEGESVDGDDEEQFYTSFDYAEDEEFVRILKGDLPKEESKEDDLGANLDSGLGISSGDSFHDVRLRVGDLSERVLRRLAAHLNKSSCWKALGHLLGMDDVVKTMSAASEPALEFLASRELENHTLEELKESFSMLKEHACVAILEESERT